MTEMVVVWIRDWGVMTGLLALLGIQSPGLDYIKVC